MRAKILEQLGFGIWETSQDIKSLHKSSASKENIRLVESYEIDNPLEIDDHDVHIDEHLTFMLGNEFSKRVEQDHKLQSKLLEHIKMHKKFKNIIKEIEENIGE